MDVHDAWHDTAHKCNVANMNKFSYDINGQMIFGLSAYSQCTEVSEVK